MYSVVGKMLESGELSVDVFIILSDAWRLHV